MEWFKGTEDNHHDIKRALAMKCLEYTLWSSTERSKFADKCKRALEAHRELQQQIRASSRADSLLFEPHVQPWRAEKARFVSPTRSTMSYSPFPWNVVESVEKDTEEVSPNDADDESMTEEEELFPPRRAQRAPVETNNSQLAPAKPKGLGALGQEFQAVVRKDGAEHARMMTLFFHNSVTELRTKDREHDAIIERQGARLEQQGAKLDQQGAKLEQQDAKIEELQTKSAEDKAEIADLRAETASLRAKMEKKFRRPSSMQASASGWESSAAGSKTNDQSQAGRDHTPLASPRKRSAEGSPESSTVPQSKKSKSEKEKKEKKKNKKKKKTKPEADVESAADDMDED
ncbi:uncharacterized protein BKA78DRAFT_327479 [Phyllosticta capitalensis]|uniref:uncharacterized protein n=1 Tax=Phyllosticta capitalensis TaxID=121624 RepID=UPI003130FEA6